MNYQNRQTGKFSSHQQDIGNLEKVISEEVSAMDEFGSAWEICSLIRLGLEEFTNSTQIKHPSIDLLIQICVIAKKGIIGLNEANRWSEKITFAHEKERKDKILKRSKRNEQTKTKLRN